MEVHQTRVPFQSNKDDVYNLLVLQTVCFMKYQMMLTVKEVCPRYSHQCPCNVISFAYAGFTSWLEICSNALTERNIEY